MNKKKCSFKLIGYELRNINGNFMTHFFGIVFPNIMSLILAQTVGSQVPDGMRQQTVTSIMLSMSLVIPMAIMLLGYGCIYSQEVERGIPLRMQLFGFEERVVMAAKVAAHVTFMTVALVIFGVFQLLFMDVSRPRFASLLCLLVSLYLIGVFLLIIAHSLANLFRRFSVTFGVSMILYFGLMILTGMMGIRTEQLPEALRRAARTLPMTYVSNDFIDFWQGGSYNYMPLLQSFHFLGAMSGILLLLSLHRSRRVLR